MSDLFEENNESQDSSLSLDDRKEQLESKVTESCNEAEAAENDSRVDSAFEIQNDLNEESADEDNNFSVNLKKEEPQPLNQQQQLNQPQPLNQPQQQQASRFIPQSMGAPSRSGVTQPQIPLPQNSPQVKNPYSYASNQAYPQGRQQAAPPYLQGAQAQYMYQPQNANGSYMMNNAPNGYYINPPKKPMDKSLKVFLTLVISLTCIFVIGFFADCAVEYRKTGGFGGISDFESWLDTDFGFDDFDDKDHKSTDSDRVFAVDTDEDDGIRPAPDTEALINPDGERIIVKDQPSDLETGDYSAAKVYNKIKDSVVGVVTYDGTVGVEDDATGEGTGIIITSDGYIVTNSHVISDTNDIGVEVILDDERTYIAKVVGYDTRTDLAVIKINETDLVPAEFVNSDHVQIGQDAYAVGNPGGIEYSNSLTRGIVSALNRTVSSNSMVTYIQTDAAINPGNSGGPLLNKAGQVMGINTIKIASASYEGMGFAIPSNTVLEIANDLMTQGYVSGRVRIGVTGTPVSSYLAEVYDVPQGIRITDFADDSPFNGTDAKLDDIITKVDDTEIKNFSDLFAVLADHEPGDTVTVTLYRSSSSKTILVDITLLADRGETQVGTSSDR